MKHETELIDVHEQHSIDKVSFDDSIDVCIGNVRSCVRSNLSFESLSLHGSLCSCLRVSVGFALPEIWLPPGIVGWPHYCFR